MACERDPLRSVRHAGRIRSQLREPEEVPMAIVGGLDIHRRQITYEWINTTTGETCRGQLSPASRLELRAWLAQFRGQPVVEVLNAVYEVDFLGFSYGFRPGRGPHDALDALVVGIERKKVNWVLDADFRDFFTSLD